MRKPTKQVIVIRKDLKMRRGKEISQGSHASIAFLTRRLQGVGFFKLLWLILSGNLLKPVEMDWISHNFTKICLVVNSEEELNLIFEKAKEEGLEVHLVTDSGATEFKGVPTKTCLAIGPDFAERIDVVTSGLHLY